MDSTQLVFIEGGRVFTDSLIVSEVFSKEHKNVVRDIEVQMAKLREGGEFEFSRLNFEQSDYVNERGRTYQKYVMTEDGFAMIAMSYVTPAAMRMKVAFLAEFKRMRERLVSIVTPSYAIDDPIERAQRWIAERQERDRIESERVLLAQTLESQTPKVEAFDAFIDADGTMTFDQVAKILGMRPKPFRETLRARKLIRQDGLPYQRFTPRYFEVVPFVTSWGVAKPYARVTTEGIAYIERLLAGREGPESYQPDNVITLEPRRPSTITLNLNLHAQ